MTLLAPVKFKPGWPTQKGLIHYQLGELGMSWIARTAGFVVRATACRHQPLSFLNFPLDKPTHL
jgi:hypothetical protein